MKRIVRIVVVSVLLLAAIVAGGSLYMLSYSLRPDATMRAKNASSYEYMYGEYPFLRPWVDSLERTGASVRKANGCTRSMRRLPVRRTGRR